jgi:hypothetical protein
MESKIQECAKQLSTSFKIKDDISKIEDILKSFFLTSSSSTSSAATTNGNGCTSIIKSGERKGKPCGASCVTGKSTCKRHTTSDEEEKKESKTEIKKETAKKEVVKKEPNTVKKSVTAQAKESPSVFKKIEQNIKTFSVMRNAFGNYEHKETSFLFDTTKTGAVIGKQCSDGTIAPLSLNDIELCKENNWNFEIPLKLANSDNQKDKPKRPLVTVEDDDGNDDDDDEDDN